MTQDGPLAESRMPDSTVTREQLEIYGRELHDLFLRERRLREELEKQNLQLESRVQELSALNQLFQQHLREQSKTVEAHQQLLGGVLHIAAELRSLADRSSIHLSGPEPGAP